MANDPKDENDLENNGKATGDAASDEAPEPSEPSEINAESDDETAPEASGGESGDDAETGEETNGDGPVLIEEAESDTAIDKIPADIGTESEARSEPTRPAPSGPSTFAVVFGGLIAGAIGFLVATFAVPDGWPNPPRDTDQALADQIAAASENLAAQSERLDALQAEIANAPAVSPSTVDLGPVDEALTTLTGDVDTLTARLDELNTTLEGFATRLAVLEERPAGSGAADGSAAMEAQLEAFRSELDEVTAAARAEIEAAQARAREIEAEAAAAADAARQRALVADIQAALESGAPFSQALSELPDAPDALSAVADNGVTTLAALQSDFPGAARAALASAQVVPEDAGAGERLAAFVRRQTNARSLSPQEGDDADAVLSRAEAALRDGDLGAALAELEALPDAAKPALSDWISAAEERRDAVSAVESLTNTVN